VVNHPIYSQPGLQPNPQPYQLQPNVFYQQQPYYQQQQQQMPIQFQARIEQPLIQNNGSGCQPLAYPQNIYTGHS